MQNERNHFRELTFNLLHRMLPRMWYMTDIDSVWYSHIGSDVTIHAIIDVKASQEAFEDKDRGRLKSSLCATFRLAARANVPFYIIRHDDAYTEWDIYHVLTTSQYNVIMQRASTREFVEWIASVRGRSWANDLGSMDTLSRDKLMRLFREPDAIVQDIRQPAIMSAIENAFERLSPTWQTRVAAKLSAWLSNFAVRAAANNKSRDGFSRRVTHTPTVQRTPPPNNRWHP